MEGAKKCYFTAKERKKFNDMYEELVMQNTAMRVALNMEEFPPDFDVVEFKQSDKPRLMLVGFHDNKWVRQSFEHEILIIDNIYDFYNI